MSKIYLVGGAVRDSLLKLPVKERDWVVVGGSAEELLAQKFIPVGKDFPVFLHPTSKEEYALARTERKTRPGYYGFECDASADVTLEEDLLRRDFTINAMALDNDGNIIDPYGGQQDLQARVLRHVSQAFSEDPVRILRAARFMARFKSLGFTIHPSTMQLMQLMVKQGEVNHLVAERVWQELNRALITETPSAFYLTLQEAGALAVLWPDLAKLWGVKQNPQYHPEIDTGLHVMLALDKAIALGADSITAFAVLTHDLGKGKTEEHLLPSHPGHEERGVPLIIDFCNKYKVPKEYRELSILVSRYHLHCHRILQLPEAQVLELLNSLDAWRRPDRVKQFALACMADAKGRGGAMQDSPYPQAEFLFKACEALAEVPTAQFMAQGLQGLQLKQAIISHRLHLLSAFKANWITS